jgi:hypothetical protein
VSEIGHEFVSSLASHGFSFLVQFEVRERITLSAPLGIISHLLGSVVAFQSAAEVDALQFGNDAAAALPPSFRQERFSVAAREPFVILQGVKQKSVSTNQINKIEE